MKVKSLSHVQLWATPWTAAYRTPPSIGCSRQEYWSGVPSPSPIIHNYLLWKLHKHFWTFNRSHRYTENSKLFHFWIFISKILKKLFHFAQLVYLFATLWTVDSLPGSSVHGDSTGKNTGGLPCPSPGDLPNPGIEPRSSALQVASLRTEPSGISHFTLSGLNI